MALSGIRANRYRQALNVIFNVGPAFRKKPRGDRTVERLFDLVLKWEGLSTPLTRVEFDVALACLISDGVFERDGDTLFQRVL